MISIEGRTRCLRILVAGYLLVLWIDQVFFVSVDNDSLHVSDIVLSVTAFAALVLFPQAILKVLRSPPALWCLALFASLILSTILNEGTLVLRPCLRLGLQFALLVLFATVALHDAAWFGRFAFGLAAFVMVVAALGFLIALLFNIGEVEWASRRPAFLVRDEHPMFGNWPRPVGGFSMAAEKFGFWAMVASAVIVAGAFEAGRRYWVLVVLSTLIAVATLTVSASGGLLFIPVWLHYRGHRKLAFGITAPLVALLLVAQVPVHVTSSPDVNGSVECLEHSPNHVARSSLPPDGSRCHLLPAWEGKVLTRYGLAKQQAYRVWRRSPFLGQGLASFKREARSDVDDSGNPILWAYGSPHSALAGTVAEHGILGLFLFVAFGAALVRTLRKVAPEHRQQVLALTFALVGFAAAAISQDAHKERLLWMVCGYAIGLALRAKAAKLIR